MRYAGWLQSSTDPDTISNSVRGGVLMFSATIIFVVAKLFHIELSAESLTTLAPLLGALAGALWTAYGLVLKVIVWLGTVR